MGLPLLSNCCNGRKLNSNTCCSFLCLSLLCCTVVAAAAGVVLSQLRNFGFGGLRKTAGCLTMSLWGGDAATTTQTSTVHYRKENRSSSSQLAACAIPAWQKLNRTSKAIGWVACWTLGPPPPPQPQFQKDAAFYPKALQANNGTLTGFCVASVIAFHFWRKTVSVEACLFLYLLWKIRTCIIPQWTQFCRYAFSATKRFWQFPFFVATFSIRCYFPLTTHILG